jgi:hypothetical protein
LPRGQIVFLFGSEFVEFVAHGFELEPRDFLVQMFGNHVDLSLQVLGVLDKIFGRQSLVSEALSITEAG